MRDGNVNPFGDSKPGREPRSADALAASLGAGEWDTRLSSQNARFRRGVGLVRFSKK